MLSRVGGLTARRVNNKYTCSLFFIEIFLPLKCLENHHKKLLRPLKIRRKLARGLKFEPFYFFVVCLCGQGGGIFFKLWEGKRMVDIMGVLLRLNISS